MLTLRGEPMSRPHTPTHTCEHGERTDRTTTNGLPLCALCRARHLRSQATPAYPVTDWQTVRSGDDTWSDEPLTVPDQLTDSVILAALFADDARGRRLRHRILASL